MSEVKNQGYDKDFWNGEYKKAKAGEKTIADTMTPEQLKEFKSKPRPTEQ